MNAFPFISLPLEIRCQIYRELLLSDAEWIRPVQPWVTATMKRFPMQYMVKPWPHPTHGVEENAHKFHSNKLDTAILLVNKQIYTEARGVLLRENPISLRIDGRGGAGGDDKQALEIMDHARVLALRVENYDLDAQWFKILKQRTNLRTIRIRLIDRDQDIGATWLIKPRSVMFDLEPLAEIRACAVATVECLLENRFRMTVADVEKVRSEKELLGLDTWLEKSLAPRMLRAGCPCAKSEDGTHADRVDIGRGGVESIRKCH
jgi:hypothetical protein